MMSRSTPFHQAAVGLFAGAVLLITPAASQEVCHTFGAAQYVDALHYCVSSVLAPEGTNQYGPSNLGDGNPATAWCEGIAGHGIGESITLRISNGTTFRRLLIGNGYTKSQQSYLDNSRPHVVEITTDRTPPSRVALADQGGILPVPLVDAQPFKWVKLKILSVYPGQKYSDTCVSFVMPDFEYEDELLSQRQQAAAAPAPAPVAPARPAVPSLTPAIPAPPAQPAVNVAACMKSGSLVNGRLVKRYAKNISGNSALLFFVELNTPGCAKLDDGSQIQQVGFIQLMPDSLSEYLFLKNAGDGVNISVSGRFEASKLDWHIGQVLLVEPQLRSK